MSLKKVTFIDIWLKYIQKKYGPNSDAPNLYDMVRDVLLEFDDKYIFLCGDFNLVRNPSLDTENYKSISEHKARN